MWRKRRSSRSSEASVGEAPSIHQGTEQTYDSAVRFLAARPRSTAEVRRRLARQGYCVEDTDAAVGRLRREGLLDDQQFAEWWIGQRQEFSPRGPRLLKLELRLKGVGPEAVEEAVSACAAQQSDAAYRLACRRSRRLSALDERSFSLSLGAYLQRRGFHYDVVRDTVQRAWAERGSSGQPLGA